MAGNMDSSIFFDVSLPSAATWFYFSGLLAVALFFKFSRLLSVRNLDVLTLFLLMPGMLLALASEGRRDWWAYFWLFIASGYFLARSLMDLILVRRPALAPNLSPAGLFWLAGMLFASLIMVPVRLPAETSPAVAAAVGSTAKLIGVPVRPSAEGASKGESPQGPISGVNREIENRLQKHLVAPPDGPPLYVWRDRCLAMLCHLSIVVGMVLIGWRHFDDFHNGVAAATFYLLLPYTYLLMPATALGVGRWEHAWPMALMVWSVFCYRRPMLAGLFLGLAAGSLLFPVLTLPVWLSFYWRRGAARFGLAFLLSAWLCLGAMGLLLYLQGDWPQGLPSEWALASWQPWRESAGAPGFWQGISGEGIHWAYRIPVFVVYLTFVLGTLFWPAPKNLAHVLALSSALLVGIQFWYADRGGVHVLWYLPFLLLMIFRPNLTNAQPPRLPADDWPARLGRAVGRLAVRWFKHPEPATPVT
jgi:hypothetical protein